MSSELTLPGQTVDAQWLKEHLNDLRLVILDASWYMPDANRDGHAEFIDKRIPGAQFFDFDKKIADTGSDLPHMLPTPEVFEAEVRKLGVDAESVIVCYDGAGLFAAPRAWWMFKAFGHHSVAVLNGGLPAWADAGGEIESGNPVKPQTGDFRARLDPARVADAQAVLAASDRGSSHILDARGAPRFAGTAPEPRAGLRSGHMPHARNLPFTEVVSDGRLRPAKDLARILTERGIDGAAPVITTCGSGVTAAVLALAIEEAGLPPATVYDGSWAEWGARKDLPVEMD